METIVLNTFILISISTLLTLVALSCLMVGFNLLTMNQKLGSLDLSLIPDNILTIYNITYWSILVTPIMLIASTCIMWFIRSKYIGYLVVCGLYLLLYIYYDSGYIECNFS